MTFMNMTLIEWMPMILSIAAAAVIWLFAKKLENDGKKTG